MNKWDTAPAPYDFIKPHTMYDEVIEKLDEDLVSFSNSTIKPDISEQVTEASVNEVETDKKDNRNRILKRRKSYIYQNLYKKRGKVNARDKH